MTDTVATTQSLEWNFDNLHKDILQGWTCLKVWPCRYLLKNEFETESRIFFQNSFFLQYNSVRWGEHTFRESEAGQDREAHEEAFLRKQENIKQNKKKTNE